MREGRVVLADGNQYFNRPGPRLVESLEILAEILHPEAFDFGHEGRGLHDLSYAVVLGRGEKRLGLAVDRLLGQQEVVIKALDPIVSAAGLGLAGATIMGDGRVVLILDVAGFFGDRRLLGARPGAVA